MKSKTILFLSVSTLSVIIFGLFFLAIRLLDNNSISALFVVFVALLIITFSFKVLKRFVGDLKDGFPIDDERSKKIRMYAASYSYFISIYIWLALLAFHKYLDRDDILIAGLLGMAISFFAFWEILSKRKGLE
ncbi:MAG: hypothetical protein JM58_19455 [Peptococcaceae bacterium BICA1-8]|nr:MAG: hypothetical protein JM58_19455 [Peptococcaceae bacterium BICA1-8]